MNEKLNVMFFGNNPVILENLIEKSNVQAIFCIPDNNNENIIRIKEIAKEFSLAVKQPNKKELYTFIPYIKNTKPDLIVVCGYKYIIPKEIFNIPKFRTINIHPSYLPAYRGQHVINWAIINGKKETGITIHFIDEGIDTGDIIIQKKVPILFEDTAATLHDKLYHEACELLLYVLNCIASGKQIQRKKQNDDEASYFKPRVPEDGRIDWNRSGLEIYNLIRALVKPWPGAYSYIKGKKIIIWCAKFENNCSCNQYSNGEIIEISDSTLTINVKDGRIIIEDYMILDEDNKELDLTLKIGDELE